jgi:hypothetical protein
VDELDGPVAWRKSSYSADTGNCVEIAAKPLRLINVRDSKDAAGPALVFSITQWTKFIHHVKAG